MCYGRHQNHSAAPVELSSVRARASGGSLPVAVAQLASKLEDGEVFRAGAVILAALEVDVGEGVAGVGLAVAVPQFTPQLKRRQESFAREVVEAQARSMRAAQEQCGRLIALEGREATGGFGKRQPIVEWAAVEQLVCGRDEDLRRSASLGTSLGIG